MDGLISLTLLPSAIYFTHLCQVRSLLTHSRRGVLTVQVVITGLSGKPPGTLLDLVN